MQRLAYSAVLPSCVHADQYSRCSIEPFIFVPEQQSFCLIMFAMQPVHGQQRQIPARCWHYGIMKVDVVARASESWERRVSENRWRRPCLLAVNSSQLSSACMMLTGRFQLVHGHMPMHNSKCQQTGRDTHVSTFTVGVTAAMDVLHAATGCCACFKWEAKPTNVHVHPLCAIH